MLSRSMRSILGPTLCHFSVLSAHLRRIVLGDSLVASATSPMVSNSGRPVTVPRAGKPEPVSLLLLPGACDAICRPSGSAAAIRLFFGLLVPRLGQMAKSWPHFATHEIPCPTTALIALMQVWGCWSKRRVATSKSCFQMEIRCVLGRFAPLATGGSKTSRVNRPLAFMQFEPARV